MAQGDYVRRLAAWTAALDADALPDKVIAQARILALDTIGCALAALGEEEPEGLLGATASLGGAPQASVIGQDAKTSMPNAVLANGALLRFLDLNDFSTDTAPDGALKSSMGIGGHPSDNIAVALAAGEWRAVPGREVLAALVLGYEICARLRRAQSTMGPWDGTSVSGLAAAAMAGRLMSLDAQHLAHAIALGAARCATPGVMRAGEISAGKFIANALIAQSAAQAAVLAEHGLTGPLQVLEHERGLGTVFGDRDELEALDAPLGDDCAVMRSHMKAYPCLATGQTAIAAGIEMHGRIGGRTGDIEAIDLAFMDTAQLRRQIADPGRLDPHSRESADHSFPFLAAVALKDGIFTARQFAGERWNDPEVRALMGRLAMRTDPAWNEREGAYLPCTMTVTLKGGATETVEVARPPGFTESGIPEDEAIAKFDAVTEGTLPPRDLATIKDMVLDLDRQGTIAPLMELLRSARAAD